MSGVGEKVAEACVEVVKPLGALDKVVAVAELTLLVCTVLREVRRGGKS